MSIFTFRDRVLLAAFIYMAALLPATCFAQAMADHVPDDAMLYFGWRGTNDLGPNYDNSELKALAADMQARAVFNEVLPRAIANLKLMVGPQATPAIDAIGILSSAMWRYPSAVYGNVSWNGTTLIPHIAAYCQAGADSPNLKHTIDTMLGQAGNTGSIPIHTALVNNIVVLSIGFDDATQAVADTGNATAKSLAAKDVFKSCVSKCGGNGTDAVGTLYVDFESLLALADDAIGHARELELRNGWPKVRDALGLGGIKRMIVSSGFDGKMWSDRAFVEAPVPRTGVAAMLDARPLADDELKVVPVGATSMSTVSFDLAKLITDARAITAQIDPEAGEKFDQVLGVVQMYIGKSLVRDILEPLGSRWIMFNDPHVAGTGFASSVLVNKLDDPVKAGQGLNALAIAINNTANAALQSRHLELAIRQAAFGELKVSYVALPLFAPAWAVHDGLLYVGMYPQSVAAAAMRETGARSILDNPTFVDARKSLAIDHLTSIAFLDLPKVAPSGYSNLLALSRLFLGTADIFGGRTPEPIVPPLDVLMKHVSPIVGGAWTDEQGFYSKSLSPFPGASFLDNSGGSNLTGLFSAIGPMIQAMNEKH